MIWVGTLGEQRKPEKRRYILANEDVRYSGARVRGPVRLAEFEHMVRIGLEMVGAEEQSGISPWEYPTSFPWFKQVQKENERVPSRGRYFPKLWPVRGVSSGSRRTETTMRNLRSESNTRLFI
jgi:hypothetical protein